MSNKINTMVLHALYFSIKIGNNVQTKGFTISKNRKLNAIRIDAKIVGKKASSIKDPVFGIQMKKEVPENIILNGRKIPVAKIEKLNFQ